MVNSTTLDSFKNKFEINKAYRRLFLILQILRITSFLVMLEKVNNFMYVITLLKEIFVKNK